MAIYMKIEGGKAIDGPVTVKGFEKQIELQTTGFGGRRNIPQQTKSHENRANAEAQVDYVDVSKLWDGVSSGKLYESLLKGTTDMTATISFTSANDSGPLTYLTVKLTNVGLTSYHLSGVGNASISLPTESLTLSFTKIEITPYTVGSDKKPAKGGVISFDLPTGQANS